MAHSLDTERYWREGYLCGVPTFEPREVDAIRRQIVRLASALEPGQSLYALDGWERYDPWLAAFVRCDELLDRVEAILGDTFYQWGSQVMCKLPHEPTYIPWHQDIATWPFKNPDGAVSIWIALDDADETNGAMYMIPGSHKGGERAHRLDDARCSFLSRGAAVPLWRFRCDADPSSARTAACRRGEAVMHHPGTIHGSPPNETAQTRCALVVNYAAPDAGIDVERWRRGYPFGGAGAPFLYLPARGEVTLEL